MEPPTQQSSLRPDEDEPSAQLLFDSHTPPPTPFTVPSTPLEQGFTDDRTAPTPPAIPQSASAYAPLSTFQSAVLLRSLPFPPSLPSPSLDPPFFKGVRWSPDGSCLLTSAEDHSMRLYEVHSMMSEPSPLSASPLPPPSQPALTVSVGETVYDYAWYPLMHSANPPSCGFLTTARDHPIQLWDAFTGQPRCSYLGFDQSDEPISALSVSFSCQGEVIYSGYDSAIRIFDTSEPGRDCDLLPLQSAYRHPFSTKRRRSGQYGLISSLSSTPSLLAAGSYSGQVGLYDLTSLTCTSLLTPHPSGVTTVHLTPTLLFTAGRGSDGSDIFVYDLRQMEGGAVGRLQRRVGNNQRVQVDVGGEGRWVISGGQDGRVRVWDLTKVGDAETGLVPEAGEWVAVAEGEGGGVVNGVAMHPSWSEAFPHLATVSGCRLFPAYDDSEEEEKELDEVEVGSGDAQAAAAALGSRLALWQVRLLAAHDAG